MSNKIFNRHILKLHRNRIANQIEEYDFLFQYSAENIIERLKDWEHVPESILELGARHGKLSQLLSRDFPEGNIITTDISEKLIGNNPASNKLVMDEEILCFKENSFDLILSNLNLHWINDLPSFLQQVKNTLTQSGLFIADFIGGESLKNFRKNLIKAEILCKNPHTPHLSPMIELHSITGLLQNLGFKNIITYKEIVSVEYQNILSLMKDLQYMGESNSFTASYNYALNRSTLKALQDIYAGTFEEYFEIISINATE